MNRQLSCRVVTSTLEWLAEVRAQPVEPVKRKPGRPKGSKNPPREPKLPRPQPIERERRLAPDVVSSDDPWIEIAAPVEGFRHIHVEGGSMAAAARLGLQRAREWWKWLEVRSVVGIEPAGAGWKVTLRVMDPQNPLLRRRWRFDWYS